jgi:hypothetical protein
MLYLGGFPGTAAKDRERGFLGVVAGRKQRVAAATILGTQVPLLPKPQSCVMCAL